MSCCFVRHIFFETRNGYEHHFEISVYIVFCISKLKFCEMCIVLTRSDDVDCVDTHAYVAPAHLLCQAGKTEIPSNNVTMCLVGNNLNI